MQDEQTIGTPIGKAMGLISPTTVADMVWFCSKE